MLRKIKKWMLNTFFWAEISDIDWQAFKAGKREAESELQPLINNYSEILNNNPLTRWDFPENDILDHTLTLDEQLWFDEVSQKPSETQENVWTFFDWDDLKRTYMVPELPELVKA